MGLLDRILGRNTDLHTEPLVESASRRGNLAVAEYERMLRTAPTATIEKMHVEAFEKLPPQQLDVLFDRFTNESESVNDRPANAQPVSLAKAMSSAEARNPGAIRRVLSNHRNRDTELDANNWLGLSILDTIATYAIATAI